VVDPLALALLAERLLDEGMYALTFVNMMVQSALAHVLPPPLPEGTIA
jgi:hypothetical protein